MKTQILKTNEKTINKKVKKQILDLLLPGQKIVRVRKVHVAGCGYVNYYENAFGVSLVAHHQTVKHAEHQEHVVLYMRYELLLSTWLIRYYG